MKQNKDIGVNARAQIAENLPQAIHRAIEAYHNFMEDDFLNKDSEDESSKFKNKSAAAKAGLAHIELLMKLADQIGMMSNDNLEQLSVLIEEAKRELGEE